MKRLAVILALFLTGHAFAQVVGPPTPVLSPPFTNRQNGHIYILINQAANWTDSEALAVSLGGHLATIRNQEEDKWIQDTFFLLGYYGYRNLWTGLNDAETPGKFVWASGEPVTYTNWGPGEPGGVAGSHYVAITSFYDPNPFIWGVLPNAVVSPAGRQSNGVIEIVPKPEHEHSHDKDKKEHKDKKDKD